MKGRSKTMQKNKLFFILSLFLLALFALYSTSGAEEVKVDKSKWPKRLAFGGSVLGASDYIICNGMANILTQKLGLDITVQATAGNVGNVRMIDAGQCELSVTTSAIYIEALSGTGWTKGKKYENVRSIIALYPKIPHFWTPVETGIKDIMDLNGKRVNLSKAGSTADMVGRRLFEIFSIKPAKITNVEHMDANNLMRDGLVDANFTVGLPPLPAVSEFSLTNSTRVIGFTEQQAKMLIDKDSYLAPVAIPKGTYKGVDYDVHSVADMSLFIISKKAPIDFAYMVTKTVLENLDMLREVHKSAEVIKPENIEKARGPIHLGAYLYYKEKGLKVPKEAMPVD
jgi:TRAP transporter TAXI family solute receptor